MALFKCKMCGGDLEIDESISVGTCQYCGTQQTLPRLNDDRRTNLYDRAGHFRRNNDFDKAMSIYEKILEDDRTDAEAYWSIVICKYGIEYVEDPVTHKRVPTVNRAQFTSIFMDEDYKSAIKYADAAQRSIYESEARMIDDIRKDILEISKKEKPFDIFICYKETDTGGRRTADSVLATDLYHQLTQEGFKVFFSRITLEDKLGQEYEPYIFAALHSARVMVVLGTRQEYFNAVWVKNEWARYLQLTKQDAKKTLIPAYKDMDPYDLPEEFSHLQALDMSKLGFMQDLIRGIKKILAADEADEQRTVVNAEYSATIDSLLGRAFLCIEDGDFVKADEFLEQVLNMDFKNAGAYIGKLMCDMKVTNKSDLSSGTEPLRKNANYKKALRFAKGSEAEEIREYDRIIFERNKKSLENINSEIVQRNKLISDNEKLLDVIMQEVKEAKQEFEAAKQEKNALLTQYKNEKTQLKKHYDDMYEQVAQQKRQMQRKSGFLKKLKNNSLEKQLENKLEEINNKTVAAKKNFENKWRTKIKETQEKTKAAVDNLCKIDDKKREPREIINNLSVEIKALKQRADEIMKLQEE